MPRASRPTTSRRILAPVAAAATALAAVAALSFTATAAHAASTLCSSQTASVADGAYTVENNEWNSSASECVSTDGNADFTVANSAISNPTSGAPGGYPAIYKGCHWGACTSNSGLPIQVGSLTPGKVTTSWTTTQTYAGAYDVAYDIWYNQSPTTSGQPNAEEMMIWLNDNGGVERRLGGRNQRHPGRAHIQHLGRPDEYLEGRLIRHDQWHHLGQQPRRGHPGRRLSQPRVHDRLGLPDRPGGGLRAVAGRRRAGHRLILGQHQRRRRRHRPGRRL